MNFMDFDLSDHDFWPSRDVVYEHFQANFHQTVLLKHVILDATEVPYSIHRPNILKPKEWRFRRTRTRTL